MSIEERLDDIKRYWPITGFPEISKDVLWVLKLARTQMQIIEKQREALEEIGSAHECECGAHLQTPRLISHTLNCCDELLKSVGEK